MGAQRNAQLESFLDRLSTDQTFADLVASDPSGTAAAAGLTADDAAHVARAVARAQGVTESVALVQKARTEVEARGAGAFVSATTEQLIRLGRAAHATARLCADRTDEALQVWGDVNEWRDRIAALRHANIGWPGVAASELAKRERSDDPEEEREVALALAGFADLDTIASA